MGPNGSEDCTRHEGAGTPLEFNQIEPVFSLAFEEVRADIRQTCAALDISPGKRILKRKSRNPGQNTHLKLRDFFHNQKDLREMIGMEKNSK